MARRDQPVIIAIAAQHRAHHPRIDMFKGVKLPVVEQSGGGGGEQRLGQLAASARGDRLTVEQGPMPGHAQPAFADDRLIDDPQHRPAILQQRDQRAEDRAADDEAARAVDGVQHPGPPAAPLARGFLFADNAVHRPLGDDQAAHRGFGLLVGERDGGGIGLGLQPVFATEIGADRRARRIGEALGEIDIGLGDGHGPRLKGDGARR